MKRPGFIMAMFAVVGVLLSATHAAFGEWQVSGSSVYQLGRVGIGKTSPSAMLDVQSDTGTGVIVRHPSTGAAGINLRNSTGYWHISAPRSYESGSPFSIYWHDGAYHRYVTIKNDGKFGIGTSQPDQELHVRGSQHTDVKIEAPLNYNAGILLSEGAALRWLLYNDADEDDRFRISNGTTDWVTVEQNGNVGIGVSDPGRKLEVAGTIRAEEIIVETGWADHVFDEAYPLRSLKEVEHHIREQGRLPDMPTAEHVREQGIGVGDLQTKLLQKVEELTLYLIDQQKEIDQLKQKLAQLQSAGQ